jgi:hypothetical protein
VPRLQRDRGVVGFIRDYLGRPVASTAVSAERTAASYAMVGEVTAHNDELMSSGIVGPDRAQRKVSAGHLVAP